MKTIHLDTVGGIAGDMFVAGILDTFPEFREQVLAEGAAVLPDGVGEIRLISCSRGGISGQHFSLAPGERSLLPSGTFREMVATIEAAKLRQETKTHAIAILGILAEAEAGIHGVPVESVHFHEIADWDSLLDVVCAGCIAALFEGTRWTVSPLPRGGGLVRTAHGLLPVPAPATAAILQGFRWRDDGVEGERVTPTGAAILKHLVGAPAAEPVAVLTASGVGVGTRSLPEIPNILRVLAFEDAAATGSEWITVIEFELDDMSGEEVGVAADRLRAVDGVLDLSYENRTGKKGRPVQSFRLLARKDATETVIRHCFDETSTIGLRLRDEERRILYRETKTAGEVPLKIVARPGGRSIKAESDALISGASLEERRDMKRRAENLDE